MQSNKVLTLAIAVIVCALFGFGARAQSNDKSPVPGTTQKGAKMEKHAKGEFDVKVAPLSADDKDGDSGLGRMSLDKQYHGGLQGTAKGQMLTAGTAVQNSGVYVAIEKVTGTLDGRKGTFILQHSGTMVRGTGHLVITVVPDSGTEELAGLSGKMQINIVDGKHFYEFDYAITPAP